jgi:dephospho-CoA kinase
MIIIGLTGSIGMGKSTVAAMLRRLGVPVFDADAQVHKLQARGGAALPLIEAAFPGTTSDQGLDRAKLGAAVFGNKEALKTLERIIHPLVGQAQLGFRRRNRRKPMVVLDIPLLFEGSGWKGCDLTVVVSAPYEVQRERVLARPGMTPEKFDAIVKTQLPDAEKRARADVVIPTGDGKIATWRAVKRLVSCLQDPKRRYRGL